MLMMVIILILMITSIIQFVLFNQNVRHTTRFRSSISFEVFYSLILIYCIVIIGFGMIYFILSFQQITLIENVSRNGSTLINHLFTCFYFSGVTLLTIGYGDITPVGIGRLIAIIQALIGFILPTAFVLKLVYLNFEQKRNR